LCLFFNKLTNFILVQQIKNIYYKINTKYTNLLVLKISIKDNNKIVLLETHNRTKYLLKNKYKIRYLLGIKIYLN